MKITIGFSPCPNDTFIFDALINGKIDTNGFEFESYLEDVETLNQWAVQGKLDISKLSFPALFQNTDLYTVLSAGAALGMGVGPLLVAKKEIDPANMEQYSIAIPGINTTANFLLSYAYPRVTKRIPVLFSEIENRVLAGDTELGVLIHENRFTYAEKGLNKIADLGAVWEEKEQLPIPLGCIAAHKRLPAPVTANIEQLIRQSLTHSFRSYPKLSEYVHSHAQTMEEQVMRQHIELYVNNYSMDLGPQGRQAIIKLFEVYAGRKLFEESSSLFFERTLSG